MGIFAEIISFYFIQNENLRVDAGPDGHRSSFHGNPWHMRPIMGL